MITSPPSASTLKSPATSIVKSPLDKSISVPSIVMLSATNPPSAVTLLNSTFASVDKSWLTTEFDSILRVLRPPPVF